MADTRISGYAELTTPADGDLMEIIDVSDTSLAATGTNKFITYANLIASLVTKALYDAHSILFATSDNTPAALAIGEQTVVGRATGGNIAALAIDSDLSSVSANDDTLPSAKATKAALDGKANSSHTHAASDINSGTLAHERGGLEADISAVVKGDLLVGTGAGTMGLLAALGASDGDVPTIQADGSLAFEAPPVNGGASALDDLTDVAVAGAAQGDILMRDGIGFINQNIGTNEVVQRGAGDVDGLAVGEQTVVGRATGGNIAALAIDSDLSAVSANDDTIPSAKATKTALDGKAASTHNHAASDINSGTLAHERGGLEADISAIVKGDLIIGTGAGAVGLKSVGTDGHVLTADSAQAGGVKWASAPGGNSGGVAQVVSTVTGAVATGSTIMPKDDTIPQNTEGDEYMTLAITPTDANSKLVIEIIVVGAHTNSSVNGISVALFKDSDADALAASHHRISTANHLLTVPLRHVMTAAATSEITFKVRAGGAASGTMTFNGESGGRRFGGITVSSIVITEVLP